MSAPLIAEEQARRVEQVGGHPIAISSHRLGDTWYAKAEIDYPGAKARIAQAQANSRLEAEMQVMAQVQSVVGEKG
jgi:hypothetical protein